MVAITLVLAAAGLFTVAIISFAHLPKGSPLAITAGVSLSFFVMGILITQWLANWLMIRRPARWHTGGRVGFMEKPLVTPDFADSLPAL